MPAAFCSKRIFMKIKHIFLTVFSAFTVSVAGLAQTARQVLDQTASKLKNSGGIEATFEGTSFKGIQEESTTSGHIYVQGGKFKISSDALTTWFDGHTQWTLLSGSDEVNVSNPTPAELQQINPYTFVNLYKEGYALKLGNLNYKGKVCHEVRLNAQNKGSAIQLLIVVIDKQTLLPQSVRIKDNHGNWTRIRIQSLRTGRRWKDATFKFDEKQHPGIEVIDLR